MQWAAGGRVLHIPKRVLIAFLTVRTNLALLVLAVLWFWPSFVYADTPTFTVWRAYGTGSDSTTSVAVGDVDGDGDLDLVIGNNGHNAVYVNDGTGNFYTGSDCSAPDVRCFGPSDDNTTSMAVGDVDGDGDLDLVTGNDGQNAVYAVLWFKHFLNRCTTTLITN